MVLILTLAAPAFGQDEPTPDEKKALAVELTTFLEKNPLHEKAKQGRSWLTVWLVEVPDITVKACSAFHGPYVQKKREYATEIFMQMVYGQAAFIVRNPDLSGEDFAVYRAGLGSSLRAYEAIVREKPGARDKYLDNLAQKMEAGELDDFVRSKMKECR